MRGARDHREIFRDFFRTRHLRLASKTAALCCALPKVGNAAGPRDAPGIN
jgi:hypothetical protein